MAPGRPRLCRFYAPKYQESHCAGVQARVDRLPGSNKSSVSLLRVSVGTRCFQGAAPTPGASWQLQQWDASLVSTLRLLPPVFQQKQYGLPQVFDAFVLSSSLPVRFGDFRAERDKPFVIAMYFRIERNFHSQNASTKIPSSNILGRIPPGQRIIQQMGPNPGLGSRHTRHDWQFRWLSLCQRGER